MIRYAAIAARRGQVATISEMRLCTLLSRPTTQATILRPLGSTAASSTVVNMVAPLTTNNSGHSPYQHGAVWSLTASSQYNMLLELGVLGFAAVAAAAAGFADDDPLFTRLPVARCDDSPEEDDPYDTLPEKDEPTHCSICLTYRQGPCRPYWRKVEACTKDHEMPEKKEGKTDHGSEKQDDDNDSSIPDTPCLKYMMPWIDCASSYRNLYSLIEMDTNFTEGIADLEATAAHELCWAPSHEPAVDWSAWQDYVELLNPEWKLPKASKSDGKHFWKSLDHSKDPELVQVEAQVPIILGEGILECAYALDQNGDVIGFAYGTKPSEAAASKDKKDGDNKDDDNGMASMTIRIQPTRTRHIVLAASYTHVNEEKRKAAEKDKDKKDDGIESHIFKSRPFQLDVVANRNTQVNIAA